MQYLRESDRVALIGASGFVGGAALRELERLGVTVVPIVAPRLRTAARSLADLAALAERHPARGSLSDLMIGCTVVINAAGMPDATSRDGDTLFGANALLPMLIVHAAHSAGCSRVVHVSSAVVQGDKLVLDSSSDRRPFSTYSASKSLAEEILEEWSDQEGPEVVIYRPPSVHAPGRRITNALARIARSPVSSVAAPGTAPSAQALLPNVASALCYVALAASPPRIVHHPWEGQTVEGLLRHLGGRDPKRVPAWAAKIMERVFSAICRVLPPLAPHARRLQLLWFGQEQAPSWLTQVGWVPPNGSGAWRDLVKPQP